MVAQLVRLLWEQERAGNGRYRCAGLMLIESALRCMVHCLGLLCGSFRDVCALHHSRWQVGVQQPVHQAVLPRISLVPAIVQAPLLHLLHQSLSPSQFPNTALW